MFFRVEVEKDEVKKEHRVEVAKVRRCSGKGGGKKMKTTLNFHLAYGYKNKFPYLYKNFYKYL